MIDLRAGLRREVRQRAACGQPEASPETAHKITKELLVQIVKTLLTYAAKEHSTDDTSMSSLLSRHNIAGPLDDEQLGKCAARLLENTHILTGLITEAANILSAAGNINEMRLLLRRGVALHTVSLQ